MEIRSIEIDFDKNLFKINGKESKNKPVIINLHVEMAEYLVKKLFNVEPATGRNEECDKIEVRCKNANQQNQLSCGLAKKEQNMNNIETEIEDVIIYTCKRIKDLEILENNFPWTLEALASLIKARAELDRRLSTDSESTNMPNPY